MPTPNFGSLPLMSVQNASLEELRTYVGQLQNHLIKLQRDLTYLLGTLDYENIFSVGGWRVTPDQLASKDGDVGMSTEDTAADDIRFWAGDVKTGAPLYYVTKSGKLYALDGTFIGTITGSTITGSVVRTAASGARVEMNATEFTSYDSGGIRRVLLSPNTPTYGLSGFEFRDGGDVVKGHIFSDSGSMGIIGQAALGIRSFTGTLTFSGFIDFSPATVTGLATDTQGSHDHGGTGSVPDHNHGLNSTDYLQCYDAVGNPTSKKQWVPSGGHNHTIATAGSHSHTVS